MNWVLFRLYFQTHSLFEFDNKFLNVRFGSLGDLTFLIPKIAKGYAYEAVILSTSPYRPDQ